MRAGQRTDFEACLFVNLRQVGADRTFPVCSATTTTGHCGSSFMRFFTSPVRSKPMSIAAAVGGFQMRASPVMFSCVFRFQRSSETVAGIMGTVTATCVDYFYIGFNFIGQGGKSPC